MQKCRAPPCVVVDTPLSSGFECTVSLFKGFLPPAGDSALIVCFFLKAELSSIPQDRGEALSLASCTCEHSSQSTRF